MQVKPRLAGALIGAIAAFGVAGVSLAGAQEAPTTTTPPATEAPSADEATPAPDAGDRDCDHEGEGAEAPAAEGTSL